MCGGVVCELDSVFSWLFLLFVFVFSFVFWLGLAAAGWLIGFLAGCLVGGGLLSECFCFCLESLILAQDERWRRALHMQVERDPS